MKIILVLGALLFISSSFAQKKELKEKALQEIDSLVANALEFLGRSDSTIIAAGRPASIIGGDKWDAEVIKEATKNTMGAGKSIMIGTGCGALMLNVSEKSNLAYVLTFLPHKKAKLDGPELFIHLSDKYVFDKSVNSIFQAKDGSYLGLSILAGGIVMIALKDNKKDVRFEE